MKRISIQAKYGNDWCHCCGERATTGFAEFTIPRNAEHSTEDAERGYFRLCVLCVDRMDYAIEQAYKEAGK